MSRWMVYAVIAGSIALYALTRADAGTEIRAPQVAPATTTLAQAQVRRPVAAEPVVSPVIPTPQPDFLKTSGNQIVDSQGRSVRLAGINWYGFENTNFAPEGLWARNYKSTMDHMARLGFNAIRLPFSLEMFEPGSLARSVNATLNTDLVGLSAVEVLDRIVSYAGKIGLRIILDNHRSMAGIGPNPNGLWYFGRYTEADWIATWTRLAGRYAGNPTVIGADLLNEPHDPANWGEGGPLDWHLAATRAGDAIHLVNPNWLIFVEGVQTYRGQRTWWGGNLMGVATHPVRLRVANRVVYSPHDYPGSVHYQPWLAAPEYPASLAPVWNKTWGYIHAQNLAPLFIGEFGAKLKSDADRQWFSHIVAYMNGEAGDAAAPRVGVAEQGISWAYWAWNPTSADTEGVMLGDWTTAHEGKIAALQPAMGRRTPLTAAR